MCGKRSSYLILTRLVECRDVRGALEAIQYPVEARFNVSMLRIPGWRVLCMCGSGMLGVYLCIFNPV